MSDREILLRWLANAAARMSWNRRIRELGRFACVLAALLLLAEGLKIFGVPLPFTSAVDPLLAIVALAVVVLLTWWLVRSTTLAQAAGAADSRADLKDELKNARWFAQFAAGDAFIELLLTRAARTAQALNIRQLFPLAVPNSLKFALVLALVAGTMAWYSPRITLPVIQQLIARSTASEAALDADHLDETAAEPMRQDVKKSDEALAAWSQVEKLTKQLPAGSEAGSIKRAVASRDAGLATQLLQALQRNRAGVAPLDRYARPRSQLKSAEAAQRLLDALKRIPNNEKDRPPELATRAEVTPTVRTATRLRAQAREERRNITGTPTQGEVTPNNRLRAISRAGVGMREVSYGEGEAAEAGTQTSVSGAATGDRTGRSQAGGSEGEHPNNSPTGEGDDQPVLGERTERLVAQLEKMSGERNKDSKQEESDEEFYSLTQRQSSRFGYENIIAQWRAQHEAVVEPGGTPLTYREAVKQYFLSQHAKDE